MKKICRLIIAFGLCTINFMPAAHAIEEKGTIKTGAPIIGTFKTIAFGPDNTLFVGDNDNNYVYAIKITDTPSKKMSAFDVKDINGKIAAAMGTNHKGIWLEDVAINPATKNVFIAASRLVNGENISAIFRVNDEGLQEFNLDELEYSRVRVTDALPKGTKIWSRPAKNYTFTDMHYVNGEVLVSGLSNEEFSSSMRRIAYPFKGEVITTGLQVYHTSHGSNETHAPISRFFPVKFGKQWHIVAGYACTPLVTINMEELNGKKLIGKTVAEIGAGNSPTGIISYHYKGSDYVLVGNNRHSLVKFTSESLANASEISKPSRERGVKREKISLGRIAHIVDYDSEQVLMIVEKRGGNSMDLKLIAKAEI